MPTSVRCADRQARPDLSSSLAAHRNATHLSRLMYRHLFPAPSMPCPCPYRILNCTHQPKLLQRRMGSSSGPSSSPASPRTVVVNPPVEEDLFVTPLRQAASAVSLLLRLALWPLFLLREMIMLPRRCAAVGPAAGWGDAQHTVALLPGQITAVDAPHRIVLTISCRVGHAAIGSTLGAAHRA